MISPGKPIHNTVLIINGNATAVSKSIGISLKKYIVELIIEPREAPDSLHDNVYKFARL